MWKTSNATRLPCNLIEVKVEVKVEELVNELVKKLVKKLVEELVNVPVEDQLETVRSLASSVERAIVLLQTFTH